MPKFAPDLEKVEQEIFDLIFATTIYLNHLGVPLKSIKQMINAKIDDAFDKYEKSGGYQRIGKE